MAQLQSRRIQMQQDSVDSGQEAGLAFPATAAWVKLSGADQNGTERSTYLIFGTGAPSTNYNNATNGSLYQDYTNLKWYVKTADTSWTVIGSVT